MAAMFYKIWLSLSVPTSLLGNIIVTVEGVFMGNSLAVVLVDIMLEEVYLSSFLVNRGLTWYEDCSLSLFKTILRHSCSEEVVQILPRSRYGRQTVETRCTECASHVSPTDVLYKRIV